MAKVIVLEGPDGSGKTTLARKLESMGWEYHHEGPPERGINVVEHYLRIIDSSLKSPRNIVHDRLFAGETVYGPIHRNYDAIGGWEGLRLFKRLTTSRPIFQFLCMPKHKILEDNLRSNPEDLERYGLEKFRKICDRYWELDHVMNWRIFDYTKHHAEYVAHVTNQEYRFLPEGTIGSPVAKYLFIGDQPNHDSVDVPFFALNGSSGYLNTAITICKFAEDDLAFSNAFGPRGNVTHSLEEIIWSFPEMKHMFLMGGPAKSWFDQQMGRFSLPKGTRFHVHKIQHPSYLKRFKGSNPEFLADIIKGVLDGKANQ